LRDNSLLMMVQKEVKVQETVICKDAVLFNSDTLSKVISYLPSIDLLNLALTCTRFSASKCIYIEYKSYYKTIIN